MKNFKRDNLLFSLCGLNCGLCPMNLNQSCSIAKCSLQHENIQYCFRCETYPCGKYESIDEFDSFIAHRHQKQHMEKFREPGIELYSAEQHRKKVLLNHLLNTYNDGRKKTMFCAAVNLLELDDLENIINELDKNALHLSLREKAAYAASLFQETAAAKNITLKLRIPIILKMSLS